MLSSRLTWAIIAGLVIGKLLGIGGATMTGLRAGLGQLPEGMRPSHAWGVASLGGIGFTGSLFIAQLLAFETPALQEQAKIGIFTGSLASGVLGAAMLMAVGVRSSRR